MLFIFTILFILPKLLMDLILFILFILFMISLLWTFILAILGLTEFLLFWFILSLKLGFLPTPFIFKIVLKGGNLVTTVPLGLFGKL